MEDNTHLSEEYDQDLVFSRDAFETDAQLCVNLISKLSTMPSLSPLSSLSLCDDQSIDRSIEKLCERFEFLITKWQISPQHIDSHLKQFMDLIIAIITESSVNSNKFDACFRLMSRLVSCVGYKHVCQHFPTQVFWLPKLIDWCEQQNSDHYHRWHTRYCLLLWLSIAVKTPFHLNRFDSNCDNTRGDNIETNTINKRIRLLIDKYLTAGDKCQDSAALLTANYFSRPDVLETCLIEFMEYSINRISNMTAILTSAHIHTHFGHAIAVATLFKLTERKLINRFASLVIDTVIKLDDCGHELVAKIRVKLIGRAILSVMTPKIAKWRYQRGKRLLSANLISTINRDTNEKSCYFDDDSTEYEEIPEDIERIFEFLLRSLRYTSTRVRWSAAKYIARITDRLPKQLACDVVSHVLELCEWRDSDSSLHGSCLALAEMCRRGLILPQQLSSIIDVVEIALLFDEVKGSFSVGSHVRDAACFVCWSLARAYEPKDIEEYVHRIAPTLLCVVCFDREVNCRRAASAAVQELVGRTQIFPHGIEVVTLTDFHSMANLSFCYLNIAKKLATKIEFSSGLVKSLLLKCEHWDREIREIASRSFGELAKVVDMSSCLPQLLSKCTCFDLNSRHGSILAVAEIIFSLDGSFDNNFIKEVESIAFHLREKNLLRGIGGEFMKRALCVLIAKCSHASLAVHSNKQLMTVWSQIVCESISSDDKSTRNEAINCLWIFCETYLCNEDKSDLRHYVLLSLRQYLESTNISARIGASQSLRLMSNKIIDDQTIMSFFHLILSHIKSNDKLCESRASEVITLIETAIKFNILNDNQIRDEAFSAICHALNDRTKDSRGDIGGTIRLAAIEASLKLIHFCNEQQILEILKLLSTECVSVWQRARELASNAFKQIVFDCHFNFADILKIRSVFDGCIDTDLIPFVKLLRLSIFTYDLWRGFVTSIADTTEKEVRPLIIQELKRSDSKEILDNFVLMFKNHINCDRLSYCCLISAHFLLSSCRSEEHFKLNMLSVSWDCVRKSNDVRKLVAVIDVFCACIQLGSHIKQALSYLIIFLCHRFPRVRSVAATQTYAALLTIEEGVSADVFDILTETDWSLSVEELRPIRDKFCDLMAIPKPKRISNK